MDVLLLFPHQLFASNAQFGAGKTIVLIEDALYFRQYAFHKQKLILHRASMRLHAQALQAQGLRCIHLESGEALTMHEVMQRLTRLHPGTIHYIDPVDDWLERRLIREAKRAEASLQRHETPMFLLSSTEVQEALAGRRMSMASFYARQRRRFGILMDGGKPCGGRWSYDSENRKRMPKGLVLPSMWKPKQPDAVLEATRYVERHFGANPGSAEDFAYPVTHEDAQRWLEDFIGSRLALFGDYEDAIVAQESVLFHSVLSPLLNIGLLEPRQVLDAALAAPDIPINALEGFVRQIIGWREFVRGAYVVQGRQQRTRNFWEHLRPLPQAFWQATTGVAPVDTVIALKAGYAHHIERLMILGNFMQLCGFRPDDIHRWFMELFIDAYDWVMVPNVYGMALYADGGLMTTKPYIGGSNYLLKMSDFPRAPWCSTWDALFWSFVQRHERFFSNNHRLAVMARQLQRMPRARLAAHNQEAERFLSLLSA